MLGKRFPLAHLRALTPDERFDEDLAQLERTQPHLVVTDMAKEKRAGRVFIDWSQNADHKTTVAVYSLCAKRDQPVVSLPVALGRAGTCDRHPQPGEPLFRPGYRTAATFRCRGYVPASCCSSSNACRRQWASRAALDPEFRMICRVHSLWR